MWKKLGIAIAVLLVAAAGFLYFLKHQLTDKAVRFAAQQGVILSADNIETDLFASRLKLKEINYKVGNIELKNINAEFSAVNIENSPDPAVSAVGNNINFSFNNRPYTLSFDRIKLVRLAKDRYRIEAQNAKINQSTIAALQGDLTEGYFLFNLATDTQLNGTIKINREDELTRIIGQTIPTELIQAILSTPTLISGVSDFDAQIRRRQSGYLGTFHIQTRNGVINNLNLLDIVAQNLPVNYDEEKLSRKNINTEFDLMESRFTFNDKQIGVQEARVITEDLTAEGEGEMSLTDGQCRFILNLRSTDKKYRKIVLPVRFYGDCHSPQYKIEFNKNFRQGLKEMIKERLK